MKIFISWSGERSKKVAFALKEWLPDVFQGDEIFMSAHDIEAGARWGNRLNTELESSSFGIVCLTPENLSAPWLLFEAGALSKAIEESHVVPYLLELKPTDVKGPLGQFQGAVSDENGTLKLLQSINAVREKSLPIEQLKKLFSKWWPDLLSQLTNIKPIQNNKNVQRTELDLLEEVLQLLRSNIKVDTGTLHAKASELHSEMKYKVVIVQLKTPINIDQLINHLSLITKQAKVSSESVTEINERTFRMYVGYEDADKFDRFVTLLQISGWLVTVEPPIPRY